MKSYLVIILLLFVGIFISNVEAQNTKNRTYLSVSAGYSIPLGYYGATGGDRGGNANRGMQYNLLNLGIKINDHLGIASNLIVGDNQIDTSVNGARYFSPWQYIVISVGPMFTFPTSRRSFIDLKPMIGRTYLYANSLDFFTRFGGENLAFVFSTTYRYILHRRINLILNADFMSTKVASRENSDTQEFDNFSLNVGLGFNF